jgi:hypothetical protein
MNWVEVLGYVASALIVTSLAMTSVVRLRTFSLIGALIFIVYAALLGSIPIIVTNLAVAGLNLWFLRREFGPHRDLGAVPINPDAPFLVDFLRAHRADLQRTWPGFDRLKDDAFVLVLMRDGMPAGVLAGQRDGKLLRLDLDYVMAAYRDSRIGHWLYSGPGVKVLRDAGIARVVVDRPNSTEADYLRQVGFRDEADGTLARDV